MLKLIAVNYTVMLNGYTQWLNIKGEKQFHRDIIYIYAFSRRFYPKRLTLHSSYNFLKILSALAFPGNRTHDLGVASAMLYYLSYRKATTSVLLISVMLAFNHKKDAIKEI